MTARICAIAVLGVSLAIGQPVQAGEVYVEPVSGIEFLRVPAGCFAMGVDAAGDRKPGFPIPVPNGDEVPRHEVCLDAFWMSRTEVTHGQWGKVLSVVKLGVHDPIADVSWDDATNYVEELSRRSGETFRLATEAEWEYACRAGTYAVPSQPTGEERLRVLEKTSEVAWYAYRMGRDPRVHEVGYRKPNAWGLHDMLGNVWEWTADSYQDGAYARHAKRNPRVATAEDRKVIRGGSYRSRIDQVRCGARSYAPVDHRSPVVGFRVVRELGEKEKAKQ